MTEDLIHRLETAAVDSYQEAGGLLIFGLRIEGAAAPEYTTLDEAMAAGTLDVTEVSEGGSVPHLKVSNAGEVPAFLMAGEQLVGAKQNRVLNASILAPARSDLLIPVSCVESGRWRYRSPKFSGGGTMSHGMLRKMMSRQAREGYDSQGTPTSDQRAVWGEVSRKLASMGSTSPTEEFHQVYADHRERMADLLKRLLVPEGCCGVAFALGGKIAGVDLFDNPVTLGKLWPKLVQAYVIDALEGNGGAASALSSASVAQWIHAAGRATTTPFKSPGEGHDVRLEGPDVAGAALVVHDRPIHIELFSRDDR